MSGIKDFLTWIPAIAFPLSHIVQIFKIVHTKQIAGVSGVTFGMYFFGNMGAYLFANKYLDIRTLLSFVLTAILEVVIVALIAYYKGNKSLMIGAIVTGIIVGGIVLTLILTQRDKVKKIANAAGYFPAVLFPLATIFQLVKIIDKHSIAGVSCAGWSLQILANIGAYFLIGRWLDFKNIGAFLGTGVIDVLIVYFYWKYGGDMLSCIPGVGGIG